MQIMEGNVIENVTRNIGRIGHFHSAGVPGRNEHHKGETSYPIPPATAYWAAHPKTTYFASLKRARSWEGYTHDAAAGYKPGKLGL
jgi:hypothetical protein